MAFKILGRSGKDLVTAGSSADHLSAEARKIINVANPSDAQDVATKDYVDNATTNAGSALDGTFRIKNTADQTKQTAFDVSAVAPATTRTIIMPNANVDLGLVASAIQSSEKGAVNGVATLNAQGKIPSAQIPAIAITDTFVVASEAAMLALSLAEQGDVAVRTDVNKSFILAGSDPAVLANWQELLTPISPVQSVNGQVGVVVLDTDDVLEGSVNKYYASSLFDADLATKTTSNLTEGTNLYFTEARVLGTDLLGFVAGADSAIVATDTVLEAFQKAQGQISAAKQAASDAQADADQALLDISNHISDATDAHDASAISSVPAGNLAATDVQAALNELQSDIDTRATSTELSNHINDTTGAHAASAISVTPVGNLAADDVQEALQELQGDIDALDGRVDTLEAQAGQAFEAGVAGESFAANQVWLVRRAKDGETAGRYYKAQANSSINSRVVGFIVVGSAAVSAADSIRVYKLGTAVLGSSDSAFAAAAINTPVYLSQTTAGKFTLAPSETAGQWLKEVGFVANTDSIEFQPGLLIQA